MICLMLFQTFRHWQKFERIFTRKDFYSLHNPKTVIRWELKTSQSNDALNQGWPTHCPRPFFCPWSHFEMPFEFSQNVQYKVSGTNSFFLRKKCVHAYSRTESRSVLFGFLGTKMPSEVISNHILPLSVKGWPPLL